LFTILRQNGPFGNLARSVIDYVIYIYIYTHIYILYYIFNNKFLVVRILLY
jgi:hypothetical protein